jgi:hypothetical protein
MMKRRKQSAHFLNVDLDIHSRSKLKPLVNAMGKTVDVLHLGRDQGVYQAHLELPGVHRSADATIKRFCKLIQSLPPPAAKLWDKADKRGFNIGIQAAIRPHAFEIVLAPATIRIASSLNARIVVTIYAPADR